MVNLEILRDLLDTRSCGLVNKIWNYDELGHAFESRNFLFFNSKYFTI